MRLAALAFLSCLLTAPMVHADKHECSCDKKCQEACKEGKGKEVCKCKTCDCKTTGKCSHGKCEHKDGEKKS